MKALDITCLVSGDTTDGAVSVFEEVVPPGGGPPLHTHRTQLEIFHIIEGRFRFQVDGESLELGPGDCARVPKGAAHAFRNLGDQPGRIHFELLPSGRSEEFFARLAAGDFDPDGLATFFDEYEIDLLGPPIE